MHRKHPVRVAGLVAGLTAAAMDWGTSLVLPGVAEGAETPGASGGPGSAGVSFKWFGTDGWEITFGNKTILFDPWFSRFDSGFFTGKFNPTKLEEALNAHARQGWCLKAAVTMNVPAHGGHHDELIVILER